MSLSLSDPFSTGGSSRSAVCAWRERNNFNQNPIIKNHYLVYFLVFSHNRGSSRAAFGELSGTVENQELNIVEAVSQLLPVSFWGQWELVGPHQVSPSARGEPGGGRGSFQPAVPHKAPGLDRQHTSKGDDVFNPLEDTAKAYQTIFTQYLNPNLDSSKFIR